MKWLYWITVLVFASLLFNAGTVGTVFGWALIVLAALVHAVVALAPDEGGTKEDPLEFKQIKPARKAEHAPPTPKGRPTEPWSADLHQFEVAGESFRELEMSRLFRGTSIMGDGAELQHPAALVPDPSNPHDPYAVAVYVQNHHVGYLERAVAKQYAAAVAARTEAGECVTVTSRQWARSDGRRIFARVTLRLPSPDGFAPSEPFPSGAVILPLGGPVQVTKEEEHMDVLTPLLRRDGQASWLPASLHLVEEARARSTVRLVEVRIGGQRVGVLTGVQTANVAPLVEHVARHGHQPVVRAALRGNKLKADVTLYVAKATNVDPAWIDKPLDVVP